MTVFVGQEMVNFPAPQKPDPKRLGKEFYFKNIFPISKIKTWLPTCLPKLFLGCQPLFFYFKNFQNSYWNLNIFYMFQGAKCFFNF